MIDEPSLPAERGFPVSPHERPITLNGFLVRFLGIAILAHVVVFVVYRSTMKKFDDWLYTRGSQFSLRDLRGDIRVSMMSRIVKDNVCEFFPDKSCEGGGEESKAVRSLRNSRFLRR
jgi:hypothetical protein